MLIISLNMTIISREKMLGQFFSGNKIANALYDLLGKPNNQSVIDPMCGRGDLLIPFVAGNTVSGIELDANAYLLAKDLFPDSSMIVNKNAFDTNIYDNIEQTGFDIVITNPPFVRRETYQKSQDVIEGALPISDVITNLQEIAKHFNTLSDEQRDKLINVLRNISGLADISLLSWLLCMIITKIEGYIAMVVPNTLISREYSIPVLALFKELFEIEYIVNDVNSAWFEGSAQIQTSLVVAKRSNYISKSHNIIMVDLFKEAIGRNSIASFMPKRQTFRGFIKKGKGVEGICEITKISQSNYASSTLILPETSKLNSLISNGTSELRTLEDYGIICGQGFRSGANSFFILQNQGDFCISKIKGIRLKKNNTFFKQIIQNQRALSDNFTIETEKETSSLLVIPRGYASTGDVISISHECFCILSPVPGDIQSYINIASNESIGDTKIPELSAVKTNTKNKDGIISFWYNLPPFTQRHIADVFVPRVNGGQVVARYNPNHYVVDANFITFWMDIKAESCGITNSALMALFNSSWFNVLCEESGIAMGGGALKLDSVQLQKFPFPQFSKDDFQQLSEFGNTLISSSINTSKHTIDLIDRFIVEKLANTENTDSLVDELHEIMNSYQQKRSK